MRYIAYILLILTLSLNVNGQIQKRDLVGEWQTDNTDSLYYKTDTIKLYEDINHFLISGTSHLIYWNVEKRIFKIGIINTDTEPVYISSSIAEEKLQVTNTDFGQVITLKRNNQLFDKFKITDYIEKHVDRYPHDIKELRLMRFDDLSEHKLYKYVDSLIYEVLKYDSTIVDSTYLNILRNAAATTVKIRNRNDPNPEPLIVINGHFVVNKEILKQFRLVEITGIKYLTKDQSASFYGMRAINGVIILTVSEKRFKKIWKNYGR